MKNILIRADSSSTIGTGHIMRDLVLAKRDFKNDNIIFATRVLDGNINYKIKEAGYKIEILNSNGIEELDKVIKKYNIDMIVIDHYEIDYKYEKQLSIINSQLSIMVLDDTYEKHHCNILLNHNISADESKYKGLVLKDCELRCGNKYTLIRDEFYETKKEKDKISIMNSHFSIFLAMGGADKKNVSLEVLKVLTEFNDIEVNMVTSSANPNLILLKQYIYNKPNIKLHVDSNKLAKLMNSSHLAVVSPSVILHEVLFMEVPFIAIKTAENQEYMVKYLLQRDEDVLIKFNPHLFKAKIKKIIMELQ